jgi:hypothetical protein
MIKGIVTGQKLELKNTPLIVSDSIDYLEAVFAFRSKDWDECEKWAHFSKDGIVYDIKLTDNKIQKKDHLNLGSGSWKVYLHGTSQDGMRITTDQVSLAVKQSGALNGEPLPELPLSVAENFDRRISRLEKCGGGTGGGIDRTTFFPSVSEDGVISWTNDGGLDNPAPVSIKGKDGYTPQKGVDYYTEDERQDLIDTTANLVMSMLPDWEGGSY